MNNEALRAALIMRSNGARLAAKEEKILGCSSAYKVPRSFYANTKSFAPQARVCAVTDGGLGRRVIRDAQMIYLWGGGLFYP